jgi:hypothetical protein
MPEFIHPAAPVFHTVRLVDHNSNFKEMTVEAGQSILPGMLVDRNSSSNATVHGVAGGVAAPPCFAMEQELQGLGITDLLPVGERCQFWYPVAGDEVYAILASGQNVAIGAPLESAGNGKLRALSSGVAIASAREAVNASASLSPDKRIRVEVL